MNRSSAICAEKVTRTFNGEGGVRDIDLEVEAGEVVALLGANGAGKSTLIKLFLGFLKPEQGRASVDGRDPTSARDRVGYIPENVSLYLKLSGPENLRFFARLSKRPLGLEEAKDRLLELGIPEAAVGKPASTYS
ncbi:MAG: ATP-binding cassette domain-containing protein, partial [Myxococcota bacterium]